MAEKRHVWKHHEIISLIHIWEEKFSLLKSQRRASYLHEEIKQALADCGVHKSIREIVVKIDSMTQKYWKTKCEGKNPNWLYFRRLDSFMGKPSGSRMKMEITDEPQDTVLDEKPQEMALDAIDIRPQNPSYFSTQESVACLRISSVQGSHGESGSLQESVNTIADLSNNLESRLLNILKQSLTVQEKIIDLQKPGVTNTGRESSYTREENLQSLTVQEKIIDLLKPRVTNTGRE